MARSMSTCLAGGRYDGFAFSSEEGWCPPSSVNVLYLGRPDQAEWDGALLAAPRGSVVTTTLVAVPFTARPTLDPNFKHPYEVYLRNTDGVFRVPSLRPYS